MNRKSKEINEEYVSKYISRSMMAYPSDKAIMPLIFHINIKRIIEETSIQQHNDQMMKCKLCGSFFNPYCQIGANSTNWRCSICNSINQLLLPPSDSNFTAYSLAKNNVYYKNAIFDFIPPHLPIQNHQNPIIIISIQSSIYNDVKNILYQSLNENDLFSYGLAIFDSSLQIFNFHSRSWHIISDFEGDENVFFPTKKEFMIGNSSDIKNVFLTSNEFPLNKNQNIANVCKLVDCFHNVKLLLIVNASKVEPLPSISFPVSVLFYEKTNSFASSEIFSQWSNIPSSNFFYFKPDCSINNNNNQISMSQKSSFKQLYHFLSESLLAPFKNNIKITLRAPKIFEINQCEEDFHFFTLSRRQSSVAQILSFAQFEISFNDCMNDGISISRYINIKIPLSPDPRIFRSATFPNPLHHLCVASSYLISQLRKFIIIEHEPILLKLRNKLMEISFQFPLTDSFWPHFVYQLLNSDFLKDQQNFCEDYSIMLKLKNLPPQILLLHFLPLQLVNGKLIPLFPKSNREAVAHVTEKEIRVLRENKTAQISQTISSLLNLSDLALPVVEIDSFDEIQNEEAMFEQWKHDFELSKYNYMEGKRMKRK